MTGSPSTKPILILPLIFCLSAFAAAQQPQVTAFTLTKGSLAFDASGVTFHAGNQNQRFPFSKGQISDSSIPGLQIICFQMRTEVSGSSGSERDVSTLTVRGEDGRSIDLTFGQGVEIYRVDITFSDQRQLTLWKLAWEIGTPDQSQYITVTGAVRVPGRIVWKRDLTALSAIFSAGGTTDGFGTPKVSIIRGGARIPVKLKSIIAHQAPDLPLQPGDQIEVSGRPGDMQSVVP